MKAEIGVDATTKRAYLRITPDSYSESEMLEFMAPWIGYKFSSYEGCAWIRAEHPMPGSGGVTAQYQDATAVNVDGALAVEP